MRPLNRFEMRRKTVVQSERGPLVISTVSLGGYNFETMVFPLKENNLGDTENYLELMQDQGPKNAKKRHRGLCQQFDTESRPFLFDQRERTYVPEPRKREDYGSILTLRRHQIAAMCR